jgi:hypothetical protein
VEIQPPIVTLIPVANLKPWPQNPRKGHAVQEIANSIEAFGYLSPIIVQKGTNRIIAGHGRLEALKLKGVSEVPCIVADIDDEKADLYTLADNKLTERAEWDYELLIEQLRALPLDKALLVGFEQNELDTLLNVEWAPEKIEDLEAMTCTRSIVVTEEQYGTIQRAVLAMRDANNDPEVPEGRCVELICADYLAGV